MDVHGDEKNLISLPQRLRNGSKRFRPCCVWPLTGARGVELNPFRRFFLGKAQGQSRTGCVMKMSDDKSFISTGSELGPHTFLGQPFESLSAVAHTFPHGCFFHLAKIQRLLSAVQPHSALWAHPKIPPMVVNSIQMKKLTSALFANLPISVAELSLDIDTKKTIFYWCVMSHKSSWGIPCCGWLLGHPSFRHISVIIKALWNTNIFNRITCQHIPSKCIIERGIGITQHLWTGSQKKNHYC